MLVCEELKSFNQLPERLKHKIVLKPSRLETFCWCWVGRLNRNGYAYVWCQNDKRDVVGHRITYQLTRGMIPKGRILDHLCRVRSCINPYHLEPVTHQTNTLRGGAVLFTKEIWQ